MQIKKLLAMILISVSLFVFSACDQKDQPVDVSSLLDGSWRISNIISNSETPPPAIFIDTEVRFANGGIEISDGPCNLIGGFYEVNEAGEVIRSEVHMTLMDCGINEQETAFLRYFDQSNQLSFNGEYLIMYSLQGEVHFIQENRGYQVQEEKIQ
jgi:heat shock protein HslJ